MGFKRIGLWNLLVFIAALLALLNLAMLAYFSFEGIKLREAIRDEQLLYEEAVQLVAQETERYRSLLRKLQEALDVNRELEEFFVNISGRVIVPQSYAQILERG